MTTVDPLSIPVLVAARDAAAEGGIAALDSRNERQLARVVATLAYLPRVVDGEAVDGPAVRFAVLQAQSGYWSRYVVADGTVRAEEHLTSPGTVDAVIVVADTALLALPQEGAPLAELRDAGLVRARGAGAERSLAVFDQLLERFAQSRVGRLVTSDPSPVVGVR